MADWFYERAGESAGPVTEAELARLASSGELKAATLVWSETLADWTPAGRTSVVQLFGGDKTLDPNDSGGGRPRWRFGRHSRRATPR